MKTLKLIVLFLVLVGTNIACKEKNHGVKKESITTSSGKNEGLIFAKERHIFEQPDEKSKVLGRCLPFQPLIKLDSKYVMGENTFKLVKCNNANGWIVYDFDMHYGQIEFFEKNLEIIKQGYEFEDEIGGSYGYGEMTVYFNFKTLNVEVNMGLIGINLQYPNFSKVALKKWTVKNDTSEMILERVGKKIKYTVVSGDQKIKENFDKKIFEFGASSE